VISVDTKKKEVVGNLGNKGREWQPKGSPVRVEVTVAAVRLRAPASVGMCWLTMLARSQALAGS
jgi:hypothetical protein